MSKNVTLLVVSLFLTLDCFSQHVTERKNNKEMVIGINPNLETFAMVERHANKHSRFLKNRDELLKNQECTRPMVHYAYEYSKHFDNESIAKHMAALIDTIIASKVGGQDQIFYALSHAKRFPEKGNEADYTFKNSSLSSETNKYIDRQISILIEELRQYYVKNRVDSFIKKYQYFYDGAVNEVKDGVSREMLQTLESYYRKETNDEYSVYIVPTRAFTKGEWQANACKIPLKNKAFNNVQFLSSSYVDVKLNANGVYKKFGFADNEWLQDMVVHEFGHTFCDFNDKLKQSLQKTSFLYSGKWEEQMKPIGYYTWVDVLNEHIVRTGEIRIAESTKNYETAQRLRKSYIKGKKFVLIPAFEERFKEYEANKDKYKTFQDFLPEAFDVLNTLTVAQRDTLLKDTEFKGSKINFGYRQAENDIIFEFELPTKYETDAIKGVTIAGTFNDWNPRSEDYGLTLRSGRTYELKIPLTKFEKNKVYEFKFFVDEAYWQNAPEFAQNIASNGNLTLVIP